MDTISHNFQFEDEKIKIRADLLSASEDLSIAKMNDASLISTILGFMEDWHEKKIDHFDENIFKDVIRVFFGFGFSITKQQFKYFVRKIFNILYIFDAPHMFLYRKYLTSEYFDETKISSHWNRLIHNRRVWETLVELKYDFSLLPIEVRYRIIESHPKCFKSIFPNPSHQDMLECVGYFDHFSDIPENILSEKTVKIWSSISKPDHNSWDLTIKHNLLEIPLELRTRSVCLAACRNSHLNLQYVPRHIRDYEICYIACKQQWEDIDYNMERSDADMFLYGSHSCFQHVPKVHRYLLSHMFFKWDGIIYDNKRNGSSL